MVQRVFQLGGREASLAASGPSLVEDLQRLVQLPHALLSVVELHAPSKACQSLSLANAALCRSIVGGRVGPVEEQYQLMLGRPPLHPDIFVAGAVVQAQNQGQLAFAFKGLQVRQHEVTGEGLAIAKGPRFGGGCIFEHLGPGFAPLD